ncbi:2-hydroxychromene-2-carboxylate isomerase [Candidatus Uabimicrobium amorphum]|uniref:2-hydroxychromene-2-carboxylate isomerase n=1 Tax=Uabimicrobium amorphum TaxID=2596890 RepID=A0A5S9F3D2_UABAM|nr:2-hydroxychromene-2-carboxylate isomerase [Candidatus Uabimicrobium amorphum]BBM84368.1 isomerase [Candidatus Uabimicrobium amorphum]
MKELTWFFDFISPFAYLQFETMANKLPEDIHIEYCPTLFAGFLNHWEHKGPAEIPAKRTFTYRYVKWLAQKQNIPLNMPAVHPFNPLALLRLAICLHCREDAVRKIFHFIWRDGKSVDNEGQLGSLLKELDVEPQALAKPEVKNKLRENGERAIALGVFGVPTFVYDRQIFWGYDSTEMLVDYMENPQMFAADKEIEKLPMGNIKRKFT